MEMLEELIFAEVTDAGNPHQIDFLLLVGRHDYITGTSPHNWANLYRQEQIRANWLRERFFESGLGEQELRTSELRLSFAYTAIHLTRADLFFGLKHIPKGFALFDPEAAYRRVSWGALTAESTAVLDLPGYVIAPASIVLEGSRFATRIDLNHM